jgi:3-hydroxy-9,10-secoandrosta-1,3,5(10)-triene-9,17-dione monooxygenase reductase component
MSSFDAAEFRKVLGHYPTGVTVVTGLAAGPSMGRATPTGMPTPTGRPTPTGMTIGSFTSVSLEPPLVGFLPMKSSDTWAEMRGSGAFCVNVLAEAQADLCWRFAQENDDRFADVGWLPAPSGAPILEGAIAWIDCRIEEEVDAGDHWFVLGRVEALDVTAGDAAPMLFFRGKLGGFTPS